MGFLDKFKDIAMEAKDKAVVVVDDHSPQIKEGIGKAGTYVDKKTKGKYSDKIATGTKKASEVVDKVEKPTTPKPQQPRPGDTGHAPPPPSTQPPTGPANPV